MIDFDNLSSWSTITDKICMLLINHSPEKGKDSEFYFSENKTHNTLFTVNWFTQILSNGEHVKRYWLMYSYKTKSVYCFPCMFFANNTKISSVITNP